MENKELCRQMIDRWSRSVFSKTLDYSKLAELEAEKREAKGGYYRQADKRYPRPHPDPWALGRRLI